MGDGRVYVIPDLKRHLELAAVFASPCRTKDLAKGAFAELFVNLVGEFLLERGGLGQQLFLQRHAGHGGRMEELQEQAPVT